MVNPMTATPRSMQAFDVICAALLVHLYENFPVGVDIEFTDVSLNEKLDNLSAEEIHDWYEIFRETVTWLESEGFLEVRAGTKDGEFTGVRLTMRGLAVLRAIPISVAAAEPTLAERFKAALRESGKVASTEALRLAMGKLFTAAGYAFGG